MKKTGDVVTIGLVLDNNQVVHVEVGPVDADKFLELLEKMKRRKRMLPSLAMESLTMRYDGMYLAALDVGRVIGIKK